MHVGKQKHHTLDMALKAGFVPWTLHKLYTRTVSVLAQCRLNSVTEQNGRYHS